LTRNRGLINRMVCFGRAPESILKVRLQWQLAGLESSLRRGWPSGRAARDAQTVWDPMGVLILKANSEKAHWGPCNSGSGLKKALLIIIKMMTAHYG
jgi:hypothetical protein